MYLSGVNYHLFLCVIRVGEVMGRDTDKARTEARDLVATTSVNWEDKKNLNKEKMGRYPRRRLT